MSANISMRDALYEAPGPKTQRLVRIGTAVSLVLLALFIAFVIRQFYINDQLNPKYWSFFARWTTWRFLFKGFVGTIKVAFTAGILAMAMGLLLMLGRISPNKGLSAACHVITDLFRSLPSLLLIYFFFLVIPKYGIRMPSFWMITVPVSLAASGVLAEVFRAGVNAVPKGLSAACHVITDLFRSLPSLLLIYFFFLVIPKYGIRMPSFWMITVPVSLAASGVLAEVFRAGVNAVPKGQVEAAMSLGMTHGKITRKIVLPQALRIVIPSLVSQLVVVVKDTTVAYVVSYPDLMQNARVLISNYDALVSMYFVVALIYIAINYATNQFSIYLAHRSGTPIVSRVDENPV